MVKTDVQQQEDQSEMNIRLPDSIATFFEVSNGAEISALRHCFTETAVVRDEGHTHEGHEAIQTWLFEAQRKYAYSVEPIDFAREGPMVKVCARVAGNFPGSPVQLEQVFRVAGGKIRSLEIH